jgi:SnoaL-like domain
VTLHAVSQYVPLLIAGDLKGLRELFGDVPRVNDPRLGWVEGLRFEAFVAASYQGLSEREARVEHLATTATAGGAVEECLVRLVRSGCVLELPVAVAAAGSADVLASVRVYHSMWPLIGVHRVRRPILSALPGLVLPDVIRRYHDSMAEGNVAGVLRQFEPDGVVREPRGGPHVHRGTSALRGLFDRWLADGGISMERCALNDDGTSCTLEYNLTGWGGTPLVSQACLTVYARARTGLLSEARMYDDVEPPPS